MIYYIKKLGHQELGSVGSKSLKPSRGRYFYISKNKNVLKFFPPLSTTVKNDSSLIPIIPLYDNKINSAPEKVYCNYIYHNDKYFDGTRNEYRFYLNNALELESLYFNENDIVIFRKERINTKTKDFNENYISYYEYNDTMVDESSQEIYFIECIKNQDLALYKFLDSLLSESKLRGSHAIYDGNIPEIEAKINNVINNYSMLNVAVDSSVTAKAKTITNDLASLFNATSFRDFVMTGYNNLCAVTKNVIRCNSFMNLEAAHIKPKSHGGYFVPSNGIALSRDIHWAFDKGFFTIKNDLNIIVHEKVESDYLQSYHGQKILIPTDEFFRPDKNSLEYHRDNVYGLFLTSGRL